MPRQLAPKGIKMNDLIESDCVVAGVDMNGNDAVKNTIFGTDAPKLGPCPPICDVSSPIILNK